MSWITITSQDVLARLTLDELEVFKNSGRQYEEGVEIEAGVITQVTAMVRGKVAAWPANIPIMGPEGTIPSECLFAAATIARDALVGSSLMNESATKIRQEELRKAHDFLDQIARGEVRIETSVGGYGTPSESPSSSYGGTPKLDF